MRIGLALIFVLCASVAVAHDEFVLDARRATPGPRFELIELTPTTIPSARRYQLQVQSGLPRNGIFTVLTKDFSHGFHTVASGFQLDEFGGLVSIEAGKTGRPLRLGDIVLEPGPYPRGAAWEAALVSADRAIRLFAKTVPYPIFARDGTCTVSLELVSQRADRFVATGAGFVPGDDVIIESRYSGRIIQKRQRISPDGLLLPDSISHGARGADHSARYTVKGRWCEVAVDYEWGEPALIRR